jgi:hypothetical protein
MSDFCKIRRNTQEDDLNQTLNDSQIVGWVASISHDHISLGIQLQRTSSSSGEKKKRSRGEEVETIIMLQEIRNYLSSAEAN